MVTEDTNALDALSTKKYVGAIEDRITQTEAYNARLHGNTPSVRMKKYAMTRKIAELKAQLDQASTLLAKLEAAIEREYG